MSQKGCLSCCNDGFDHVINTEAHSHQSLFELFCRQCKVLKAQTWMTVSCWRQLSHLNNLMVLAHLGVMPPLMQRMMTAMGCHRSHASIRQNLVTTSSLLQNCLCEQGLYEINSIHTPSPFLVSHACMSNFPKTVYHGWALLCLL